MSGRAAIFLDRDGTLNELHDGPQGPIHPPATPAELRLVAGADEACRLLREAGYLLMVVTNQPDVARGRQLAATVTAINESLSAQVRFDDIATCFHDTPDGCGCRKPEPGLLLELAERHGVDLARSVMIGDRESDVEAGRRAGCRTIRIGVPGSATSADMLATSLLDAARLVQQLDPILDAPQLAGLGIQLFGDCGSLDDLRSLGSISSVSGFTTNPTLMRRSGVDDYEAFARSAIELAGARPISFEVFADEPTEMVRQARRIASWGEHVFVKVPITNTVGTPMLGVVRELVADGIGVNVTAIASTDQVAQVVPAIGDARASIVSVFAGRIADTGRDPIPVMARALEMLRAAPTAQLLWASPRELLNLFHADAVGCHIITATPDLLAKLHLIGKDLAEYSLETVRMFHDDARSAGYSI